MSLPRFSALIPLVLAVLSGCGDSPSAIPSTTGAMQLSITLPLAAPGDVSRVSVTVSGADMASQSTDLVLTDGNWGGVLGDIPAGTGRTFLARAYNASSTLRYEGRADNVTVTAGATGLLALTLQDVTAPPPFSNEAPIVDSLVASATSVAPGGSVTLTVTAHDPNAGDTVSYAWSAPSGVFAAPTQASTSWTAPTFQGPVKLSLQVKDSRGATLSVSLTVTVTAGSGAKDVRVDFNTAPVVTGMTSSQSYLDVGQSTALSISASDGNGDTLSYQWSATCAGTFTGATTASATFTPSSLPTAACNNCQLSVTVKDGRGGQNTGSLALCVSKGTPGAAPAGWTPAGTMSTPRYLHRMTSLSTGKVLITGGQGAGRQATAELYDPATNTWSATASMATPRESHEATALSNGKLLVSGGIFDSGGGSLSAQLYDPAAGTWSLTGAMTTLRVRHTATLLPNGKVLVAAGYNINAGSSATAELYDPATGTWSPTGNMAVTHVGHTSTLLPTGKVLVVGGEEFDGQGAGELYDPATGTWSITGPSSTTRVGHKAVLLSNGKVLVAGGKAGKGILATAELYDPATNSWSTTGAMAVARNEHAMARLSNGKVLVSGGYNFDTGDQASAELYDPATGTWSATASLSIVRRAHEALSLPSGKVLVTGGGGGPSGTPSTAELYNP